MSREKEYFRDVVADIKEDTGKILLGVNDIKKYLHIGHNKAAEYLNGQEKITIFDFAKQLLKVN